MVEGPVPGYAVVQLGGKPYLTVTARGLFGSERTGSNFAVARVVLKRAGKPFGAKSPTATFVRQGESFVFDPARSTLSERYRWGKFDVDAVNLMFR